MPLGTSYREVSGRRRNACGFYFRDSVSESGNRTQPQAPSPAVFVGGGQAHQEF